MHHGIVFKDFFWVKWQLILMISLRQMNSKYTPLGDIIFLKFKASKLNFSLCTESHNVIKCIYIASLGVMYHLDHPPPPLRKWMFDYCLLKNAMCTIKFKCPYLWINENCVCSKNNGNKMCRQHVHCTNNYMSQPAIMIMRNFIKFGILRQCVQC